MRFAYADPTTLAAIAAYNSGVLRAVAANRDAQPKPPTTRRTCRCGRRTRNPQAICRYCQGES